jgi:hypothetical protein
LHHSAAGIYTRCKTNKSGAPRRFYLFSFYVLRHENLIKSKPVWDFKALLHQTKTKKNFESVAKQHFQNFSCGIEAPI